MTVRLGLFFYVSIFFLFRFSTLPIQSKKNNNYRDYLCGKYFTKTKVMEIKEVRELPKRIVPMSLESVKLGEFNSLYKLMVEAYARLPFYLGEEALPVQR